MILLSLRHASLTHKNPQRRNIIHGMRTDPVRVISVAVVQRCIFMLVFFCALNTQKDYISISVNFNKEFWRLSPDELSSYKKAQAFSI